jgi:hypothetical protein
MKIPLQFKAFFVALQRLLQRKEPHQNTTGEQTGHESSNNATGNNLAGKVLALLGEIVLFGGVATGLWVVGERLDTHGFKSSANAVCFLAAILFFATAPLAVQKFWPKLKKKTWAGFAIFCPILGGIVIMEKPQPPSPAPIRPHFTIGIRASTSPDFDLMLTNSFLFPKKDHPISETVGFVFIPLASTNSPTLLTFFLANDSPPEVEDPSIAFVWRTNSKAFNLTGWHPEPKAIALNDGMQGVGVSTRDPVPFLSRSAFPALRFIPLFDAGKLSTAPELVTIQVRAKEPAITSISFWLCFTVHPKVTSPHVVPGDFLKPNKFRVSFPNDRSPEPDGAQVPPSLEFRFLLTP